MVKRFLTIDNEKVDVALVIFFSFFFNHKLTNWRAGSSVVEQSPSAQWFSSKSSKKVMVFLQCVQFFNLCMERFFLPFFILKYVLRFPFPQLHQLLMV